MLEKTTASDRVYDMLEATLLSISDSQTLLALALTINFGWISKCSISWYHFTVGLYSSLVALASSLLSFVFVRTYFASLLAGATRMLVSVALGAMLGFGFSLEIERGLTPTQLIPDWSTVNSSAIFLPAGCVLDKALHDNLTRSLDDIHFQNIGGKWLSWWKYPILIFWSLIAVQFGFCLLFHLFRKMRTNKDYEKVPGAPSSSAPGRPARRTARRKLWSNFRLFLLSFTGFTCAVTLVLGWVVILQLRHFVDSSVWLHRDGAGTNPENDVRGLGQLAAIVTMGAILIAMFDKYRATEYQQRYPST